jgi:Double zinc ribbon
MGLAGCFSKLTPPMLPIAYFGIESSGLSLAVDLVLLFVVVVYLALIYWTYADARRRIVDPVMVACATAASVFPFVGTIVYVILRPPEYLEDVRERELEMQAAEARLHQLDETLCPHCDYRIERDFIRCPSCLRKLKERCVSCSRPLDQAWTICPYCEADVPGISPQRARRRRAAAATAGAPAPATAAALEADLPELDGALATEQQDADGSSSAVAAEPATRQADRRPAGGGRARRPRPTS